MSGPSLGSSANRGSCLVDVLAQASSLARLGGVPPRVGSRYTKLRLRRYTPLYFLEREKRLVHRSPLLSGTQQPPTEKISCLSEQLAAATLVAGRDLNNIDHPKQILER